MSTPPNILHLTPEPQVSVVLVTPETAARWLKRNMKNRNVRPATVAKYARDMSTGAWLITGESVKFDLDGNLLDGQHRLAAIMKSGVSIRLVVMRGITPNAQRVMDTGRARTASDALAIRGGITYTALTAAAAKLALGVESGDADPGKHDVTHAEVEAFIDSNPSILTAVEVARHVARRSDCPPTVVAYTYWQMAKVDQADAFAFWTAAAEKVGLIEGDPTIALTNRFAEARRNREVLSKRIYLSLIYRAWNARRAGKSMRFIRVNSPAGGLVPIPELR